MVRPRESVGRDALRVIDSGGSLCIEGRLKPGRVRDGVAVLCRRLLVERGLELRCVGDRVPVRRRGLAVERRLKPGDRRDALLAGVVRSGMAAIPWGS